MGETKLITQPIKRVFIIYSILIIGYLLLWHTVSIWEYAPFASLWYAPTGLSIAILVLWKNDGFWKVWACNWVVATGAQFIYYDDVAITQSLITAAIAAFAHTIPYWVAISLNERFGQYLQRMPEGPIFRPIILFVLLLIASCLAAIFGVGVQYSLSGMTLEIAKNTWLAWWIGDFVGAVILAPLFVLVGVKQFHKFINPRHNLLVNCSQNTNYLPVGLVNIGCALLIILIPSFISILRHDVDSRLPMVFAFFIALGPLVLLATRSGWGVLVISNVLASIGLILTVQFDGITGDAISYQSALLSMAMVALYFVSYFDDNKLRTEKLLNSDAMLTKASNLLFLNEIGSNLAHEINSPLQAALSFIQGSVRRLDKYEKTEGDSIRDNLDGAKTAIENIALILSRIHSFSRNARNEKKCCSLSEVIQKASDILKLELLRHSVRLQCEDLSNLPPVSIKQSEAIQVITNIIKNSIEELCNKSTRVITIELIPERGKFITISICDTGSGVQPDKQDGLFDLGGSMKQDGAGIGLWLTHSIMDRIGGAIEYVDRKDNGSCFEIKFPKYEQ